MQTADDSSFTLPALRYLLTEAGRELLAAAAGLPDTAGTVARLRKTHPAEAVHAALTLVRLRGKAAKKFPEIPTLFSPQEALEQATSLAVARRKAARFAEYFSRLAVAGEARVILDACCGIGGDAMALAGVAAVVGVDTSEIRLFCLELNAGQLQCANTVHVLCEDIASPAIDLARFAAFHIDPARRSSGRRHHAYADMVPGPDAIDRLIAGIPAGAIKLSPGVDFDSLPSGHLEIISEDSTVVQAVLYTGALAGVAGEPGWRTATSLRHGHTRYSFSAGIEPLAPVAPAEAFIAEVDPALHRAGLAPALARRLDAWPLNDDGGLITAGAAFEHPAVAGFRHITTVAFDEKRMPALLPTLAPAGRGPVEVKSRGGLDIDTDRLQCALSGATDRAYTVLLYRAHGKIAASVAARQMA